MLDRPRLASWLIQRLRSGVLRNLRDAGREQQLLLLGDAAVAPLVEELSAREPQVRNWAAEMLCRVGSAEAVAALRPQVWAFELETRLQVGKALASARDALAVEVLAPIAGSSRALPWVRYEALRALGALGDARALSVLLDCFRHENLNLRMAATAALHKLGAPAVPALIELGMRAEADARATVLRCLANIGDGRAAEFAVEQLNDPDREVRAAAVGCVGRFRPRYASIMLEVRLSDPEPGVRRALCEALGTLGERDAVPHLIQRLQEDVEPSVRAAAAWALGRCGDADAAISLFHVLLATEDCSLLEAVLVSLAEIGDARILELLDLFEPRQVPDLSRKERTRLRRKAEYAAGRIRARSK
ncbi:HEAT repeat domain-containing protein [Hyalangium versicolor]|uniref:HEAT repeat domain-containing protein n=1 Tax=Hyalangium versicolor TaxID=2861190 RepID=UPI001CCA1751|nr:HEAT repeat domain-containing protein [Hyalangium versicolor]